MSGEGEVELVHQDEHLIVVMKPSGLLTTASDGGDCLVERVRSIDPRAPALHASSRLDAEVTGLVTFARTRAANRALLEARSKGRYRRLYVGLARVAPEPPEGRWEGEISLDPTDRRRRVPGPGLEAQRAETEYRMAARAEDAVLMHLRPHTGRTHQLRVHMKAAGAPLLGDLRYGGERRVVRADGRVITCRRTMLHCAALEIPDVESLEPLYLSARVPDDMRAVWIKLGGDEGALEMSRG